MAAVETRFTKQSTDTW